MRSKWLNFIITRILLLNFLLERYILHIKKKCDFWSYIPLLFWLNIRINSEQWLRDSQQNVKSGKKYFWSRITIFYIVKGVFRVHYFFINVFFLFWCTKKSYQYLYDETEENRVFPTRNTNLEALVCYFFY